MINFPVKFHKNLDISTWLDQEIFSAMGNIGSEVSRAIRWKEKGNEKKWVESFYRSLELFDLTLYNRSFTDAQIGELLRVREVWSDFIFGDNNYNSTAENIQKYFDQFAIAYQNTVKRF